jgi:hypothetical protein
LAWTTCHHSNGEDCHVGGVRKTSDFFLASSSFFYACLAANVNSRRAHGCDYSMTLE